MLPPNIILVDKPKGITSFDVIRKLRKELGIKKMGHAGTLDPLASGLMIVATGEGTKSLAEFLKLYKTYEAEILLGTSTDTGDMEGEVLCETKVEYVEEDYVREVIKNMRGIFNLPVPKHSAVKVAGKRLYKYAREGAPVETPKKDMEVYESRFVGLEEFEEGFILKVAWDVASGVYIRSLVEFLGNFLDIPATLYNLKRTKIGKFSLKNARKL
jgi:tRNA pseudouridine55 synthase